MKKLGWSLLGLAFVAALLSAWFGRESDYLLATFGLSLVLGSVILLISFGLRLYRGEIQLRLWASAKLAALIFVASMCLRLMFTTWFFPDSSKTLIEHFLASVVFAIVFSIYHTAYRKPA